MKNLKTQKSLLQGLALSVMAASLLLTAACAQPNGSVAVTKSGQDQIPPAMKTFTGYAVDPTLSGRILGGTAETSITSDGTTLYSVIVKVLYKKSDKEVGVLMGYAANIAPKTNTTLTIPSNMNCSDADEAQHFQMTVNCEMDNCNKMSVMVVEKDSPVLPNLTGAEAMASNPSLTGYHVTGLMFMRTTAMQQQQIEKAQQIVNNPNANPALKAKALQIANRAAHVSTIVGDSRMDLKFTSPRNNGERSGLRNTFADAVRIASANFATAAATSCVLDLKAALVAGMPDGKPVPTPTPADGATTPATTVGGDQTAAPVTDASGAVKTGAGEGVSMDGPVTTTTPVTPAANTPESQAQTPSGQPLAAPQVSPTGAAVSGSTTSGANGTEIQSDVQANVQPQ